MASFNDAWQSLQMAFSGDRIQTREGMRRNSWLGPIVNQVRGLRQNYLMNHPRLSPSLQRIESSPPGNLRRRTRPIRPRVFTFGTTPIPVIEFDNNPIIPGLEFSNSPLLSSYHCDSSRICGASYLCCACGFAKRCGTPVIDLPYPTGASDPG